jgi:hypothetical protein
MKESTQKALNTVLLIGCAYEILALTTKRVPTITRILRTVGSKPQGKALVYLWIGYISAHFLEPLD